MNYGTLAEKKALSARSGFWCGGAILLLILSVGLVALLGSRTDGDGAAIVGAFFLIFRLVCAVMWLVGCAYYARSKGWSGFMGILGILTLLGVIVLVLLPDKWKKALDTVPVGARPSGPPDLTNYPR